MSFYCYILYSASTDKYYVGHTHDVRLRLADHNAGEGPGQSRKFTYKHRPWRLVCSFCTGPERATAMKVERYIKRQKSRKFIESLINSCDDLEKISQLVRVPVYRD